MEDVYDELNTRLAQATTKEAKAIAGEHGTTARAVASVTLVGLEDGTGGVFAGSVGLSEDGQQIVSVVAHVFREALESPEVLAALQRLAGEQDA